MSRIQILIIVSIFTTTSVFASFQKGFNYLKWGDQFLDHADRSFRALRNTGADWVSFVPIWYMDSADSTEIYRHPFFSPSDEVIKVSIIKAKEHGLKVMLKPHIDVFADPWKHYWDDGRERWMKEYRDFVDRYPLEENPDNPWFNRLFVWRGMISHKNSSDRNMWFENYKIFIKRFARIASELGVDQFCLGTEFKKLEKYSSKWREVIEEVRGVYSGPILYNTNHGDLGKIKFWDAVDIAGISAYYPLSDRPDPAESEIRVNLDAILDRLELVVDRYSQRKRSKLKVLFSESGYSDFRGTSVEPWNFLLTDGFSPSEQANCYKASLDLLPKREWLKGVFYWRWSVEPENPYFNYDHYSPFGKPAEEVIKRAWSGK